MVDTSHAVSNTFVGIIAESVDEDIFKLRSQSHGFLLDAILCEQGDSFIQFLLFYVILPCICPLFKCCLFPTANGYIL